MLAAATTLVVPYGLRLLIDGGLTAGDTERLSVIRSQFLVLLALAVMMAIFTSARFYMVSWLGERITTDLRAAVYANVLRQRPAFFETLQTGEVLSRLTGDTTLVQTVVGSSLSVGLRSTIMMLGGILILAFIRPTLVLTVVAILLLFILPLTVIGRRVRKLSRASQDRLADSSALAAEILNAIPVVQSFGQEFRESQRFSDASELTFRTAIRRTRMRAMLTALAIAAVFGANLYGLYAGVQAVMDGRLSAGTLGQIALLIAIIASSAAVLAEVWGDLLRAAGATERLLELLHAPGEPAEDRAAAAAVVRSHHSRAVPVAFDDVQFSYPSRPTLPAVSHLSFEVPAGATVAVVGPSGAGKTTLFQLLLRFYDLAGGRILIDGRAIDEMPLAQLRSAIALVPQDPVIFSGSAADNIRYARPQADDEEVMAAARLAFADDFIQRTARRLRHLPRRARRAPVGRAAPATRDRPGDTRRPADPAARRSHQRARCAIGTHGPAGARCGAIEPHDAGHRASPRDGAVGGSHRGDGIGAGRRIRHPSRTARAQRHLCQAGGDAVLRADRCRPRRSSRQADWQPWMACPASGRPVGHAGDGGQQHDHAEHDPVPGKGNEAVAGDEADEPVHADESAEERGGQSRPRTTGCRRRTGSSGT